MSFGPPYRPRRSVAGGVAVAKPGVVLHPAAEHVLNELELEAADRVLARGRTYARAGQVVSVAMYTERVTAQVQGSASEPYEVEMARIVISGEPRLDATCDCPYGCEWDWCKHAAALAYVAAHLIDVDPAARAVWLGQDAVIPLLDPPEVEQVPVPPELLARIAAQVPRVDVAELLAQAGAVSPRPGA